MPQLPDVRFGTVPVDSIDWRKDSDPREPDDDEELDETPEDVVEMLGFDPLDLDEEEDDDTDEDDTDEDEDFEEDDDF